MADRLTEEEKEEYTSTFQRFDKDNDGRVDIVGLGNIMRWQGHNPTFAELEEMIRSFGNGVAMDLNQFLNMLGSRFQDNDNEADLVEAFQVFDKDGKGYISITELRHILCNLGDKLPDQEAEELMKQAAVASDGNLDYSNFVRTMLSK